MMKIIKSNEGYTLIELIVVFTMMAVIVGITIGGLYMYTGKARTNQDISNANKIEKVLTVLGSQPDVYTMISQHYATNGSGGCFTLNWSEACR